MDILWEPWSASKVDIEITQESVRVQTFQMLFSYELQCSDKH